MALCSSLANYHIKFLAFIWTQKLEKEILIYISYSLHGVWKAGVEKRNLRPLGFARKKHIYVNASVAALHLTNNGIAVNIKDLPGNYRPAEGLRSILGLHFCYTDGHKTDLKSFLIHGKKNIYNAQLFSFINRFRKFFFQFHKN